MKVFYTVQKIHPYQCKNTAGKNQLVDGRTLINASGSYQSPCLSRHVKDEPMEAATMPRCGAWIRLAIFCARLNMPAMASPFGMTAAITILSKT